MPKHNRSILVSFTLATFLLGACKTSYVSKKANFEEPKGAPESTPIPSPSVFASPTPSPSTVALPSSLPMPSVVAVPSPSTVALPSSLPLPSASPVSGSVRINSAWLSQHGSSPYYLDSPNTRYTLETDVSTKGTAFAIIAKNILFDLNGHTVTFDNGPSLNTFNGSFEEGSGSLPSHWDLSQAPNVDRYAGVFIHNELYDGAHALRFSVPCADQAISSNDSITLEPNTTYSLSAMFWRGASDGATLYVEMTSPSGNRELSYSRGNNRGIQFAEYVFRTGNSRETYSLSVGVRGAQNLIEANQLFIDRIRVTRYGTHGVVVGPGLSAVDGYPELTRFGAADGSIVTDGTLQQGVGGAPSSTGVHNASTGVTLSFLSTYVNGPNGNSIKWRSGIGNILNNTLRSDPWLPVTSRDSMNGSVLKVDYGSTNIEGNTILDGPHVGINLGTALHRVSNNLIKLKGRYTNGFGIVVRGPGTEVFNNTIYCIEEYSCRGIMPQNGTPLEPIKIHHNNIKVQYLANSQEYRGIPLGGVYGIQLESSQNIDVYNNDVTAYGNEVKAYAFRMNSAAENIRVYDNVFRAVAGGAHAATLKFSGVVLEGSVQFENNTLLTNEGLLGETSDAGATLVGVRLNASNIPVDPYILEADWTGNQAHHTKIVLLDTVFENIETRTYLAGARWRWPHRYGSPQRSDDRLSLYLRWSTKIHLVDRQGSAAAGASVTITNAQGNTVYSGNADATGAVQVALDEYSITGATKTISENHTASVIHQGVTTVKPFLANRTQVVTFVVGP